jgi:hypothetical protein
MCFHFDLTLIDSVSFTPYIAPLFGLIGTILVIAVTYRGIFIKIRKDREIQTADKLRNEISKFCSLCLGPILEDSAQINLKELHYCINSIELLLDDNIPEQKELIRLVRVASNEINTSLLSVSSAYDYGKIFDQAKVVIRALLKNA